MNNLTITPTKQEHLRNVLGSLFGEIDDTLFNFITPLLEWKELHGNKYLFHQGDIGNSLYILISGRMQVIVDCIDGTQKIVGEIPRGETVGEMSLFSDEPRSAGVKAIRDSQLIHISRKAYELIVRRYPHVNFNITKLVVDRLKKNNQGTREIKKVANIALVPIGNVHLPSFTRELELKMGAYGKTLNLSGTSVSQLLNNEKIVSATAQSNLYHRFSNWLDQQEYEYDYLLFQADATPTEWTKRCLRQADEIIFIANANDEPKLTAIEKTFLEGPDKLTSAVQKLVLLHSDEEISNTREWLMRRQLKSVYHIRQQIEGDLERFARFQTGNAVGLVLSGGGAKGLAHVGVFKALKENNITIDLVGGTSFGAIPASLIGLDRSTEEVHELMKKIFLSNPTPKRDYNILPFFSLLTGRKIDQIIKNNLGDLRIEDMPVPYFCVSANLTKTKMEVHQTGLAGKAVRASISLPGVFPPAIIGKELHVDGAMFNNLPVDVMKDMGVGKTIAVDLDNSSGKTVDLEKMPTSWQYLSSKIWKNKRYRVPGMMSTMMQSSMVNSLQRTRKARLEADLFINPDVSKIGIMDWKKFHKIVDIGYQDTLKILENWKGF